MMMDSICIDYLSFEWSPNELILAYKELRKERKQTSLKISRQQQGKSSKLKKLNTKQTRYENILWRQMAKTCTNKLSYSNTLIHPSDLNWQKESDITCM